MHDHKAEEEGPGAGLAIFLQILVSLLTFSGIIALILRLLIGVNAPSLMLPYGIYALVAALGLAVCSKIITQLDEVILLLRNRK